MRRHFREEYLSIDKIPVPAPVPVKFRFRSIYVYTKSVVNTKSVVYIESFVYTESVCIYKDVFDYTLCCNPVKEQLMMLDVYTGCAKKT